MKHSDASKSLTLMNHITEENEEKSLPREETRLWRWCGCGGGIGTVWLTGSCLPINQQSAFLYALIIGRSVQLSQLRRLRTSSRLWALLYND